MPLQRTAVEALTEHLTQPHPMVALMPQPVVEARMVVVNRTVAENAASSQLPELYRHGIGTGGVVIHSPLLCTCEFHTIAIRQSAILPVRRSSSTQSAPIASRLQHRDALAGSRQREAAYHGLERK
jgi:hypothetical protein